MKLLYDLTCIQSEKGDIYHGGGEYAKSVFQALMAQEGRGSVSAMYHPDLKFDPDFTAYMEEARPTLIPMRNEQDFQALVNSRQYDRCYFPLESTLMHRGDFSAIEYMFTFHGLRPVESPTDRYESLYARRFRAKAVSWLKQMFTDVYRENRRKLFESIVSLKSRKTTIITVTNHSKYALLSHFPFLNKEQIKVFYSAPTQTQLLSPDELPAAADMEAKYGIQHQQYFLLVSAGVWRKNAFRAIKALDALYDSHEIQQKTLVLGCRNPEIFSIRHKDRFVFGPYASTKELAALYRSAYCLIYPSLNEGFGYPPLECMMLGAPVISSGITSLPEVCKDAVVYVDPYSITELKTRILYMAHEPGARDDYARRGQIHGQMMFAAQKDHLNQLVNLLLAD